MAWTHDQLKAVEDAIFAVSTGAVSYTINGRTVTKASLPDLLKLRDQMQAELGVRKIIIRARVNEDIG